jgi:DNA (cytosine-5)-methyltransferase 1
MLRVLDLFSGIGGFSLGLERTGGFQTVAFCEIEPFPRSVLKKHWPNVPIYEDVKILTSERLGADGITVDVICGGFPCQDISLAGRGAGLEGERSGLWFEFHRLIKEIKPQYAIIENVSALRSRGLDAVLRSLVEIGYDAEWHCIPASAVGAPHRRDRVWVIAHPNNEPRLQTTALLSSLGTRGDAWNDADWRNWRNVSHGSWKIPQPIGVGMDDGLSARMDSLKALGNAVVPQIPQLIGEAILASAH